MASNRALKQRMMGEKEMLFQMYHQQKLSLTDIGEHYGCSRQYVQLIFKELGIKRRSRMVALKNRPRRRKSKYNFSEDHDRFIIENCNRMTDAQIAEQLGKPVKSIIYRRLMVLKQKKVRRRNFTDEENRFILENYDKMTDTEIANVLNRSLISVTHHRNRILNRPKRSIKGYSHEEDQFIIKNYQEMTDGQLAVVLNRTKASIAIHRNEVLGLSKTRKPDHY
jgi:AraC-like DNA-binding protein